MAEQEALMAAEPHQQGAVPPILGVDGVPTGDGIPGGDFNARFTIDSRPEVGVWAGGSAWIVFRVTDINVPQIEANSDEMKKLKETLQRGLTDEQVAQYVTKIESEIGTTINQAAFAQVTGANN